jgi:hypothetical protein
MDWEEEEPQVKTEGSELVINLQLDPKDPTKITSTEYDPAVLHKEFERLGGIRTGSPSPPRLTKLPTPEATPEPEPKKKKIIQGLTVTAARGRPRKKKPATSLSESPERQKNARQNVPKKKKSRERSPEPAKPKYIRPSRRKKLPPGYISQINWKKDIEENDFVEKALIPPRFCSSPQNESVTIEAGAPSSLPRSEPPLAQSIISEDRELPINFPFEQQVAALFDAERTDSDEDEALHELKTADYENQAAIYPMNSLRLRQVFNRSYMSTRGLRASLFNTRLGVYTRQLASKSKELVIDEQPEAGYRVIFEATTSMRYETFYREPGVHAGPLELWTELGAVYPMFELDAFGNYYAADLRVWV